MFHQTVLALGPGSEWLNYEGLGAHPALPEVAQQPLPDERPDGHNHSLTQEQGCRPLNHKSLDVNTTPLTPRTWQLFLPRHPIGKRQRASTQVWTGRPETP
jgi:hypothetical protein